jgi:MarR family transcriptional regulator for hemolysin
MTNTKAKTPAGRNTRKATRGSSAGKPAARSKAASKTKARVTPARKPKTAAVKSGNQTATQRFALVSRLVSRALATRLGPKGIGYGQFPVLVSLWQEDGVTQKVLSERVRIEAPTMVRTLDRMEREGLVKRIRSETDRRRIHIHLSKKGANLERQLVPLAAEVNDTALAGITKKDRRQLDDLLARLIVNLEKDAHAGR